MNKRTVNLNSALDQIGELFSNQMCCEETAVEKTLRKIGEIVSTALAGKNKPEPTYFTPDFVLANPPFSSSARSPREILVEDYGYLTDEEDPGVLFTMERYTLVDGRKGTHIDASSKLRVGYIVDMDQKRAYCTINFHVNGRVAFHSQAFCGFNRAKQLGMRMVLAWHRITEHNKAKGGAK